MPNILLIDDNRNFQFGLAQNLRKEGFNVITASNGSEGIKMATDKLPELILCDMKMPDQNGLTVKDTLNADPSTADIPFIFLTAFSTPVYKNKGFCTGADDFITKPVDMADLVTRIKAAIQRKERTNNWAKQEVLQLLENLKTTLPIHTGHLFRTYMGILMLSLEMIKNEIPEKDKYFNNAYKSTYRLKMLVNDLIWLNEFDIGRFSTFGEHIDLKLSFTLPIKELLEIWKSKNLNVNIHVDDGVVIFAPAHSFTQAVIHLVDNACKFGPIGASIDINLKSNGLGGCILTIQDEGPGIPPALREQVFERFYQIPSEDELPQNHGQGLGLYLARTFSRTQGGDVKILDSNSGCKIQMKLGRK